MYRILYIAILCGCGPSAQSSVQLSASAVGKPVTNTAIGDWTVTLDRAELGFGPVYFCAAAAARACDAASAELTSVVAIDLLNETPQPIGEVNGLSGTVRSVTWDYGISWLTTESAPNARAPSGHSLVLSGVAVRGAQTVPFSVTLDALPLQPGAQAVLGAKTNATLVDGGSLRVAFDVAQWLRGIDFATLPAVITSTDEAYQALLIAMTANAPPTFQWSSP
jgi:hypothetical protein